VWSLGRNGPEINPSSEKETEGSMQDEQNTLLPRKLLPALAFKKE